MSDAVRRCRAVAVLVLVVLLLTPVVVGAPGPGPARAALAASPRTLVRAADSDKPGEELFRISDDRITESSGLAMSNEHDDIVYTINDSDNAAEIYAVSTTSGEVEATLEIGEVDQRDWEAIATGPGGRVWVGDIGDNDKKQTTVTLFRFREPDELADAGVGWSRYRFRYEDGPHDAEALLVHPETGRIYVVTKALVGAAIYEAPAELTDTGDNTLKKVASAPRWVTDGSFVPDGSQVVLRGYAKAYVYDSPSFDKAGELALPEQKQGESLTVSRDGERVLVGSEGKNSSVYGVPMSGVKKTVKGADAPPEKPKPTPKATAEQAGEKDAGGLTFFGLPWWVPVVIVVIALLAGIAAFPTGSRESRRRPSQPMPGPSYADSMRGDDPGEREHTRQP